MEEIPNWVIMSIGGITLTAMTFILRDVVGKFIDYIFSPLDKLKTIEQDVEDVKMRLKICEQSQVVFIDALAEMKDDMKYIRSRIDTFIDRHNSND